MPITWSQCNELIQFKDQYFPDALWELRGAKKDTVYYLHQAPISLLGRMHHIFNSSAQRDVVSR